MASKPVITWLDLQGRYRVTSPAFDDPTRPEGEKDAAFIQRIIGRLKAVYSLSPNHAFHIVEDADQRVRLTECCGNYFRYAGKPDEDGRRDAVGGAWEMDVDGLPRVNMAKARIVQMDRIRVVRDAELAKLDTPLMRAQEVGETAERQRLLALRQTLRDIPQTFRLGGYTTPTTLRAAWPSDLPEVAQ